MMTHRELLEYALLDALALLDDDDRVAFDKAFAAAPPHIQAHIRREQTRFARDESLFPTVTPPASMRSRVLEAVQEAMARQNQAQNEPVSHQPLKLAADDHDSIARLPAVAHHKRSVTLWRALAVGSAAAAIVLGITTMRLTSIIKTLDHEQDPLLEQIKSAFAPNHFVDALVDGSTQRITMASTQDSGSANAQAALWYNPDWRTAKLFGINLPASQNNQYKLAVLDENGNVVDVVAEFTFDGGNGLLNEEIPVTVSLSSERLAILSQDKDGSSNLILSVPDVLETH